jgi:YesN/AraC family two-component response regulator
LRERRGRGSLSPFIEDPEKMKHGMNQQLESVQAISILVAEDDKIVRNLLGLIIAKKFPAVTVYLAEDGRAGLELFKSHRPQLVITDINMPGMDGFQMVNAIRSIEAGTKILVVTAYDTSDYCEKFDKIGIEDYIVKPIAFERLFAAIEKCR